MGWSADGLINVIDPIECVEGLAKGLQKVKSAYPLVVAVLPSVSVEHHRELES